MTILNKLRYCQTQKLLNKWFNAKKPAFEVEFNE